ncbi:MAG TPA: aldo/keto reductase [Thermoanaerobaculia bacterium]|jgi:aryl-alcohol dehydrogenase-like predicted oxidoreductase
MNIILGTYRIRGDLRGVVAQALQDGCCFIDTAPNYHHGRAIPEIGAAIRGGGPSECGNRLTISSKVGYTSADEAAVLLREHIAADEDIVRQHHVLAPGYTRAVFAETLADLQLSALDTFFLHNPEEQLATRSAADLSRVLARVFEVLEEFCGGGKLRQYGIATWSGFGAPNRPSVLSLPALLALAREVAGNGHHFRAVQLPINLARSDAVYDLVIHGGGVLADALFAGIAVYASSPLHGGELLGAVKDTFANEIEQGRSPAEACLRFVMSVPGVDAVLVSASTREHLRTARELACLPPLERAHLRHILELIHGS